MSENYSRMGMRVANALLIRFKISLISDDDDDINDISEGAARHDLIRRRETRRLIERRKQYTEAKNSFAAPADFYLLTGVSLNTMTSLRFSFSSWTY